MNTYQKQATLLTNLRTREGISKNALAQQLLIELSRLKRLEAGTNEMTGTEIYKYSMQFNIDVFDILYKEEE